MALMDKFANLGDAITNKTKNVAQKAKDVGDIAGINSQVSAIETRLNALYNQLGVGYYNLHSGDPDPILAEVVKAIGESIAEKDALELKKRTLRGMVQCPNCGGDIPAGSGSFCPNCGGKLPELPVLNRCTGCGAELPDGAAFCMKCGTRRPE